MENQKTIDQKLFETMLNFEKACLIPDLEPTEDFKEIPAKFTIYYTDPVCEKVHLN